MSKPAERRDGPTAAPRETARADRPRDSAPADPAPKSKVSSASDDGPRVSDPTTPQADAAMPAPGSDEVEAGFAARTAAPAAASTATPIVAPPAPASNVDSRVPSSAAEGSGPAGAEGDAPSASAPQAGQTVASIDLPLQITVRADPAALIPGSLIVPEVAPAEPSLTAAPPRPVLPPADAMPIASSPELVPADAPAPAPSAVPAAGKEPAVVVLPPPPTTTDEELDLEASAEADLPKTEAGAAMAAVPNPETPVQALPETTVAAPTLAVDPTIALDAALALAGPAAAAAATIEPTPTDTPVTPVVSRPTPGATRAPFVATDMAAHVDGPASQTNAAAEKPAGRLEAAALPTFGEQLAAATGDTGRTDAAIPQMRLDQAASSQPAPSGFGLLQPTGGLQAAVAASHAGPAHPVVSGVPIQAVPVEIGLKSLAGINRFDIRLDPDDLGQIEVRLDILDSGEVRAHIVVERPDALHSLQRETSQLERALEQAGLKTGDEGVSVSLRQQGQGEAGGRRGDERDGQGQTGATRKDNPETQPAAAAAAQRYAWTRASGVDRHI